MNNIPSALICILLSAGCMADIGDSQEDLGPFEALAAETDPPDGEISVPDDAEEIVGVTQLASHASCKVAWAYGPKINRRGAMIFQGAGSGSYNACSNLCYSWANSIRNTYGRTFNAQMYYAGSSPETTWGCFIYEPRR